jgi:hypothetical protein
LYRVYPGQLLMCLHREDIDNHTIPRMPHFSADNADPRFRVGASRYPEYDSLIHFAAFRPDILTFDGFSSLIRKVEWLQPLTGTGAGGPTSPSTPSPSPGGGGGGGGKGAGSAGAPSGGSSTQGTVPALQAPRMSAIVSSPSCQRDQVVLPTTFSDPFLSHESTKFVHVYWRSLSEVFQYLGAVLRSNDANQTVYTVPVFPDPNILYDYSNPTGKGPGAFEATIFAVTRDGPGRLKVDYNGVSYAVENPTPTKSNFTRPILAIVSTMVNLAAQQNLSASSSPVRFLPLP